MKILRTACLLAFVLIMASLGSARAQSFEWAKNIRAVPDTTTIIPQATATDNGGNTYLALPLFNSLNINGTVFAATTHSGVIVKYDNTGSVLWAKQVVNLLIIGLAADNSLGGVFVLANNYGAATWDGTAVPASAAPRFYAKCSATGQLLWSNPLPANYANAISDGLVSDAAGNAYLSGTMAVSGTVSGSSVDMWQSYVLKTNGAGATQWVQVLHTEAGGLLPQLMLGPKPGGGFLISGSMSGNTLYVGTGTATPVLTSPQARFLASFDAAGAHQWSQEVGTPVGGSGRPYLYAIAADASGNCYATGSSNGDLQFGASVLHSGFLLVKYNATGTMQWAQGAQGTTAYNSGGKLLAVNESGATVVVNTYLLPLTIGTLTLRAPHNFVHFNSLGVAQWTVADASPANQSQPYFLPTALGMDASGNLYTAGGVFGYRSPTITTIQLGAQTVVGKGTIVARLNAYANTLRGQVYFDQNANGQRDAGEGLFPRQLTGVLTQSGGTTYAAVGTDGVLQTYAGPGVYFLALADLPTHYAVSQPASGSYAGTFSGISQLVDNQDFGVAPTINQADLRLTLTPYSVARAGLTTRYRLTLENVGTTTIPAGTATLTLDALMQYVSSTPAGTVAGRVVSLSYAALAPFGSLSYDVLFSLPTNAVLGTVLNTTAAAPVAGDVAPADNTATLAQTVVGPYDPNSMEVNYQRLTPAQVAAKQPLDYTIHFQNLGSAAAQNVILSDTLDFQKLNPATLMLVSQSHSCSWSLTSTGPNTGLLTVRLLGINLPEQNADVIRSMGFVRFRVQPRPTLAVGEVIPNHASIVFDYNAGIRTNTATTTVFVATAALASHEAPAWEAYPNPATDVLNIAADLPTAGPVRVELFDGLGRAVRYQKMAAPAGSLRQQLDLRDLVPGLYVLRLTPPTGPALSRRVVRE